MFLATESLQQQFTVSIHEFWVVSEGREFFGRRCGLLEKENSWTMVVNSLVIRPAISWGGMAVGVPP